MSWTRWKALELEVAKFFGGKRRIRVSYAESCEDVIHDKYNLECKYGRQVPKYLNVKVPTCLVVCDKSYMICPSSYLHELSVGDDVKWFLPRRKKSAKFLQEGLEQAEKYGEGIPVLCVKPPRNIGFIACWAIPPTHRV